MILEIRDIITIIGGAVSLTGIYFAMKKNIEKLGAQIRTIEGYHKREIENVHKTMSNYKEDLTIKNDKLESKIDLIQQQIATMSSALSELTGFLKAQNK